VVSNWIDLTEPVHVLRRLRREPPLRRKLAARLHLRPLSRVEAVWSQEQNPPIYWWDIPAVQSRWNKIISGDPTKNHYEYVAEKYLKGTGRLHGLSLGCGEGTKEVRWAETRVFTTIDAYDLSERRIQEARAAIQGSGYADVIRYHTGDAMRLSLDPGTCDVVLFEHSLHHMSPLEPFLIRVRELLKPGGLLIANEFVGPTRRQWTDRQIEVINGLLDVFPLRYKTTWGSRFARLPARRPSKLAMWLSDPSEAVQSSDILPLLRRHFDVVETRGYGGAILHLLFAGISHHFVDPDETARRLLDISFQVEDLLLECGSVQHDFALVVCRKAPH